MRVGRAAARRVDTEGRRLPRVQLSGYIVDADAPSHELTAEQSALIDRINELLESWPSVMNIDLYSAAQTHTG